MIVGRNQGNDTISNGVGKTTIFKAIEYVLFNESEESLERVIRDDCNSCKVIFYFKVDEQLYRVSRSRNKKGTSDLSLHKRTTIDADDSCVYVDVIDKDSTHWKDITSRRTGDTEKDLEKLIKINYKAFRSTTHFVQHDFTGIATLTPEKRKTLLKEVLQIIIYSKLEKLAKDEATEIEKEIRRLRTLMDAFGDPEKEISESEILSIEYTKNLIEKTAEQEQVNELLISLTNEIADLSSQLSSFDEKANLAKQKENLIKSEVAKIRAIVQEQTTKTYAVQAAAKTIVGQIKSENEKKTKLAEYNFEELSELEVQLAAIQEKVITNQVTSKNLSIELIELKIPIPDDSVCKHCRQTLTEEHKKVCQSQIDQKIEDITSLVAVTNKTVKESSNIQSQTSIKIAQLTAAKKELDASSNKIDALKKEYDNKKQLFDEYNLIVKEQTATLIQKELEWSQAQLESENFNTDEVKKLRSSIQDKKLAKDTANSINFSLSKGITHAQSTLAVLNHKLQQSKENIIKRKDLLLKVSEEEEKLVAYPSVIQGFSSSGIPSLIIQNVLDDWQSEANDLLSQIRPGLQLSFLIEKERTDGDMADTLDIEYFLNSRPREYRQLSGAQRVSIAFALKLGLAFLLQKMFGVNIRILLLDEIDQSLDKAGVDAFADIVKFFQKDFTILIITHNDRLKDKFSHAILVEQDQNMVSKAKVVSSW